MYYTLFFTYTTQVKLLISQLNEIRTHLVYYISLSSIILVSLLLFVSWSSSDSLMYVCCVLYRECLIPEVSRTYHFDTGMHINSYQQKKHFNTRSAAQDRYIKLRDLDRFVCVYNVLQWNLS